MKATANDREFFLPDEPATLGLAERVARSLPAASTFVVYLRGDLGTGKTTFTRGVLRALGEEGPVRSPTYGLVAEYATPHGQVLHLDLYRLRSPDELAALGLADYLADFRLWLVEWPEKAEGAKLPAADVTVVLEVQGAGRRLSLIPGTAAGEQWLTRLKPDQV